MNWKRTKVSAALWVLLIMITCIAGFYGVFGFCSKFEIQGMTIWAIYAGVLLLGGLFSVLGIRLRSKFFSQVKDREGLWMLLDSLLLLAILTGGILLRINRIPDFSVGDLYNLVTIKYEVNFPNTYLGAEDLYLRMLHGICFLLGNTTYYCIRFHLILTILAGLIWHFAVKRLSGRVPALIFSAFYFLSPYIINNSSLLTAESLMFLLYGIGLLFVGFYLKSEKNRIIISVVTGIVIGILGFMDVFGLTLLFVAISMYHMNGAQKREDMKKILSELGGLIGGICIGFFGSIIVKALSTNLTIEWVIKEWLDLYLPRAYVWPGFRDYLWFCLQGFLASWYGVLLIALLVFTIFGFLINEMTEKISPWIGILIVTLLFIYLQMAPANSGRIVREQGYTTTALIDIPFDGCLLLLSCLIVLAGIGIDSIFVPVFVKEEKQKDLAQSIWAYIDPRKLPVWIRKKKAERKEKLQYAMDHPETMEGKNFISKYFVERAKKKAQAKQEIDKVMNTLNSLSEDHIVWTDGVKPSKIADPSIKAVKEELAKEDENKEKAEKEEAKVVIKEEEIEEIKEEKIENIKEEKIENIKEEKKEEKIKELKEEAKEEIKESIEDIKEESNDVKEISEKEKFEKEEEVKGEIVKGEIAKGEIAKGETAKGEIAKGETAKGETAKGETAKGETASEEKIKEETMAEEAVTIVNINELEVKEIKVKEVKIEKELEKIENNGKETNKEESVEETGENAEKDADSGDNTANTEDDSEQSEMDDIEILDLDQEESIKKETKKGFNKKLASVLDFDYEVADDDEEDSNND